MSDQRTKEIIERHVAKRKAWVEAGRPMTKEESERWEDHMERNSVGLGGPIPARFKSLQHLDDK